MQSVLKEEMKRLEESSGYSTEELIQIVGKNCSEKIRELINKNQRILIVTGKGNNGRDGQAIYDSLKEEYILTITDINDFNEKTLSNYDVIIDCVFGFSFHLPLSEDLKAKFNFINNSGKTIISIDLNSGSEADSGKYDENAIRSDYTFVLGYPKVVHAFNRNLALAKQLIYIELPLKKDGNFKILNIDEDNYRDFLPVRKVDAHKTSDGRLLLFSGSKGLAGSTILAGKTALNCGCSYLHVLSDESIYPILANQMISAVFHFNPDKIEDYLKNCDAIVTGPGSNNYDNYPTYLNKIIEQSDKPILIDAYGLRVLSEDLSILKNTKAPIFLTPHLGEFSTLCKMNISDIKKDLFNIAKDFSNKHNVVLVLKGPNTIVTYQDKLYINNTGSNKLAKAGSGDCLSGLIGSFLSLHSDPFIAASLGVYLHGLAADKSKYSYLSFNSEDLPSSIKELL